MTENEPFWQEWFSCPAGLGREVFESYRYDENGKLIGNRVFLTEYSQFNSFIQRMQRGVFPCWASVLPFQKRDDPIMLEKLYFDFDSKTNIELAWKESSNFSANLKHFYNADSLLCFSGNKGYNLYVWLQVPLKFTDDNKNKLKPIYKKIQASLLKGTHYKTLDPNPYGDIKRVSRIPFSTHEKTGKQCLPTDLHKEPAQIPMLKSYVDNGLSEKFIDFCLRKTVEQENQEKAKKERWLNYENNAFKPTNPGSVRPCLVTALKKDLSGTNGHSIRIAIATEYLNNGYSPEKTAQLFQSQSDYNFDKSLYYSRDIAARAYRPFKCATIQQLGLCPTGACFCPHPKSEGEADR